MMQARAARGKMQEHKTAEELEGLVETDAKAEMEMGAIAAKAGQETYPVDEDA